SHRPTGQIQRPGRTQNWIKLWGKVKLSALPSQGDFGSETLAKNGPVCRPQISTPIPFVLLK
ncbi:hypothetical protein, partial [Bradyrhizobium sp. Ghvi]|uniref:hypothetical protein n=1 Tax=Bradyrhizobium sp. Ghvi TaxID=1855319 RepID=UPI001AEC9024